MAKKNVTTIQIFICRMLTSGGIERVTANLANLFSEQVGINARVVVIEPRTESFYEINDAVEVCSLNIDKKPVDENRWINNFKRIRTIRNYIKQEQPDVILAIWPDIAMLCTLAALGTATKVIACEHLAYEGLRLASRAEYYLRMLVYPFADAVVALTERDTAIYKKMNKNSFTIPNFINMPINAEYAKKEKLVLAVGHITYRKGFDLLIEAWAIVHDKFPDWELRIVGAQSDSEYVHQLKQMIKRLELQNSVEMLPETRNIWREYSKAAIFAMSSRQEGLPMVLIEAMAMGLPAVSFDCPTGPREIIKNGETGILVKNGCVKQFAKGLIALIDSKSVREQYSINAKTDITARFRQDSILTLWEKLFKKC